jgi:hypothetical protein
MTSCVCCSMRCLKVKFWQERRLLLRWHGALPAAPTIILLCLSGCSVTPPSQFPALTAANRKSELCPAIAGCYADKGIAMSGKGKSRGQASLTDVLQGGHVYRDKGPPDADTVAVVSSENGVLEFQSWHGTTQLATMRRHKFATKDYFDLKHYLASYRPKKGFVVIPVHAESSGSQIGVLLEEDSLWLRKAVDGSLIILDHDVGGGIFTLVPFGWWHNLWYQFPPVALSRSNAQDQLPDPPPPQE